MTRFKKLGWLTGLAMLLASGGVLAPAAAQVTARLLPPDSVSQRPASAYPLVAQPAMSGTEIVQPTNQLTLERLIDLAAAHNPELGVAQARAEAARGKMVQAGLYPNPHFTWLGAQMLDRNNAAGEE